MLRFENPPLEQAFHMQILSYKRCSFQSTYFVSFNHSVSIVIDKQPESSKHHPADDSAPLRSGHDRNMSHDKSVPKPRSAKEDTQVFNSVLVERMPAVMAASMQLQAMMGVSSDTRVMGRMTSVPWEMPAPPSCSPRAVIDNWLTEVNRSLEIDESVIAPAASGPTNFLQWPPASPFPIREAEVWRPGADIPLYWHRNLTRYIHGWLKETGTQSAQANLTSIDFRTTQPYLGEALALFGSIDAKMYDKVKLIRMILPPSAQSAASVQLDWIVLVVVSQGIHGDGFDSDSEDEPEDDDGLPYWVIAFPTSQITMPVINGVHGGQKVSLVLGRERRVPLVHGHGIYKRFAEKWLAACTEGRGLLEMVSTTPLPL
ncbi:hypothetical protein LTR08_006332 [Meristemomyces frigidus]|nr:hypothetical protein LTR08_006332 [Meristemomyces frigidus]